MSKPKVTESDYVKLLHSDYVYRSKYVIANSYIFSHDWESDFFVENKTGYCYEFEIKLTRADFRNDMKKTKKHSILSTGKYTHKNGKEIFHNRRPNRFYYVVPKDLIKIEEVPSYAGLIYVDGTRIEKVKESPLLHKEKNNYDSQLCQKYYHHANNMRYENWSLKDENKNLRRRYQYFTYSELEKITEKKLKSIFDNMSYKDYLKWMIDYYDTYEDLSQKIVNIGACMPRDNVRQPDPSDRWDYIRVGEKHRPLTKDEYYEWNS